MNVDALRLQWELNTFGYHAMHWVSVNSKFLDYCCHYRIVQNVMICNLCCMCAEDFVSSESMHFIHTFGNFAFSPVQIRIYVFSVHLYVMTTGQSNAVLIRFRWN